MKNHIIRNIIIFAVAFLIIPVMIIISKSSNRTGSTPLQSDEDDVVITLSRSNLDHSIIDQEFLNEVNKLWREKTGKRMPLADSLSDFDGSPQTGAEYLGTYNGYVMLAVNPRFYYDNDKVSIVANHNFIAAEVFGYKDGVLREAAELYENGLISYSDVSAMHDRLCEAYFYSEFRRYLINMTVTVPGVQEIMFPSETELQAKQAVASRFLSKYDSEASEEDVIFTGYYGKYGDTVFFTYKSPLKYYVHNLRTEEVADENFVYMNGNRIYGYDGKDIYTLTEAYEAELIEKEELAYIKKYHIANNPFALDYYATSDIAFPIDQFE